MNESVQGNDLDARRLKVLGHPDRLRLLRLMVQPTLFPDNLVDVVTVGVCVNDLAAAAELPQSTTSAHLSAMTSLGLLEVERHGQWRYVRPRGEALARLGAFVAELGG